MEKQENERKKYMHTETKKDILPVPEIKSDERKRNNSDIERTTIYGEKIHNNKLYKNERPISAVYPVIDTDLARDNVENNLTAADLQDLEKPTKS